ncbi:MAG TPA: MFS transporter [Amycolatopsis sp.]|nr:MFS transporter [Amycolatopsis sp.]
MTPHRRTETGLAALKELFSPRLRRRTLVSMTFYVCQVIPFFAIFSFAPQILSAIGMTGNYSGSIVLNGFLLAGAVVGVFVMDRISRRNLLVWTFAICAVTLIPLGIWTDAPIGLAMVVFCVFAFVLSGACNLNTTYPGELCPTELRATGIGASVAASRVGSAAGTFLFPIGIAHLGLGPILLIEAAVLVIGGVVCALWAVETRGITLNDAAGTPVPSPITSLEAKLD